MFYSHEILTSRKYGVATIWLVATLGSKSSLKKVNRKAILNVDVPRACETIIDPEAPMALRLQGNLLYGVSRVYSEQCGFTLADTQHAYNNIRALIHTARKADIDISPKSIMPKAGTLLLEDDPTFMPDLALQTLDMNLRLGSGEGDDVDAAFFMQDETSWNDLPSVRGSVTGQRGSLANLAAKMTNINLTNLTDDDFNALVDGPGAIGDGFAIPGDDFRNNCSRLTIGEDDDDQGGFIADPDFDFDEDGNIRISEANLSSKRISSCEPSLIHSSRPPRPPFTGSELSKDTIDYNLTTDPDPAIDLRAVETPLPQLELDDNLLYVPSSPPNARFINNNLEPELTEKGLDEIAPLRKNNRAFKVVPMDPETELRNRDMSSWNTSYIANMKQLVASKIAHRAPIQAKKNAEYWILERGLCGVGGLSSMSGVAHGPLDIFAGLSLLEALTGETYVERGTSVGRKRPFAEVDDPVCNEDVAHENIDIQLDVLQDDIINQELTHLHDDVNINKYIDDLDVEIARDAPQYQEDISSIMPWNTTASLHGSSAVKEGRARLTGMFNSGAASISSFRLPGSSVSRQIETFNTARGTSVRRSVSRNASASPLSARYGAGGMSMTGPLDIGMTSGLTSDISGDKDMNGETHAFAMQEARSDQRPLNPNVSRLVYSESMGEESQNFLAFIQNGIDELAVQQAMSDHDNDASNHAQQALMLNMDCDNILFEQLLPPKSHSRQVAAQGFLHILTLATRGVLALNQSTPFGPIDIQVSI